MTTTFSSPEKEYFYELFDRYYDSPFLYKIKQDDMFTMYGIQLPCFLLNEKRYLILLCPLDAFPISAKRKMKELRWISLQARSLTDESLVHLPIHSYTIKRSTEFSRPFRIYYRSEKVSTYRDTSLPFEISLLHPTHNKYYYPEDGNLVSALETFQTILQWLPQNET